MKTLTFQGKDKGKCYTIFKFKIIMLSSGLFIAWFKVYKQSSRTGLELQRQVLLTYFCWNVFIRWSILRIKWLPSWQGWAIFYWRFSQNGFPKYIISYMCVSMMAKKGLNTHFIENLILCTTYQNYYRISKSMLILKYFFKA